MFYSHEKVIWALSWSLNRPSLLATYWLHCNAQLHGNNPLCGQGAARTRRESVLCFKFDQCHVLYATFSVRRINIHGKSTWPTILLVSMNPFSGWKGCPVAISLTEDQVHRGQQWVRQISVIAGTKWCPQSIHFLSSAVHSCYHTFTSPHSRPPPSHPLCPSQRMPREDTAVLLSIEYNLLEFMDIIRQREKECDEKGQRKFSYVGMVRHVWWTTG